MAAIAPAWAELERQRVQAFEALRAGPPDAEGQARVEALVQAFLREGQGSIALALVQRLTLAAPASGAAWRLLGFALRESRQMPAALQALERAAELEPGHALTAMALAQTCLDAFEPAVEAFEQARRLAPDNLSVVRGLALAHQAAGKGEAGAALLAEVLARRPDWLEGHRALSTLRWTHGDSEGFADTFRAACAHRPSDPAVWQAYFSALAQARRWDAARAVLEEGERRAGPHAAFLLGRLFIASESGQRAEAEALFAQTHHLRDDLRDLAFVRHGLRWGQLAEAGQVLERLLQRPLARAAWAYQGTLWRLQADARAGWLDGDPPWVRHFDLGFTTAQLERLADHLRRLHMARVPYLEQSVRGGTQTDGQLFYRADPVLEPVRQRIELALAAYIEGLGPTVPGHPLLGTPRSGIQYSGSWSVRLHAGGHNVPHIHPKGWISGTLYVAVPAAVQAGPAPAGYIEFGRPPAELGLDLPPIHRVEPRPGRLALFPSNMWHGTVPFQEGERLVIAFDVAEPAAPWPFAAG